MRKCLLVLLVPLAVAACGDGGTGADRNGDQNGAGRAEADNRAEAAGDGRTTIRVDRDGARIEAEGSDIRIDHDGIRVDLDRDVELNIGEMRAKVRADEDGSLTVTTNAQ